MYASKCALGTLEEATSIFKSSHPLHRFRLINCTQTSAIMQKSGLHVRCKACAFLCHRWFSCWWLSLSLSLSLCSLFLSVCLPHLEVAHWPSLRHPCMCECTCELQGAKGSITYHETFRKISQMQMCKAQVICFLALCARPSNLYCTLYVPYHNIHKATRRTRSIGLTKGLALAEPRSRFGSACRHQAKALLPSHIETLSLTLECIEWGKKLLHG